MRRELESVLTIVKKLPQEELPEFLGDIEQIRVTALTRLTTPSSESRLDKSLTIKQAHKRLGVSRSYLQHHWKKFSFARHEGRRVLFSSNGIDAYLKRAR